MLCGHCSEYVYACVSMNLEIDIEVNISMDVVLDIKVHMEIEPWIKT